MLRRGADTNSVRLCRFPALLPGHGRAVLSVVLLCGAAAALCAHAPARTVPVTCAPHSSACVALMPPTVTHARLVWRCAALQTMMEASAKKFDDVEMNDGLGRSVDVEFGVGATVRGCFFVVVRLGAGRRCCLRPVARNTPHLTYK